MLALIYQHHGSYGCGGCYRSVSVTDPPALKTKAFMDAAAEQQELSTAEAAFRALKEAGLGAQPENYPLVMSK